MAVAYYNSQATQLWQDKTLKSIKRNAKLHQEILSGIDEAKRLDGNASNQNIPFLWDIDNFENVIFRITRGLYFYHTGIILPKHIKLWARPIFSLKKETTDVFTGCRFYSVGEDVFVYGTFCDEHDHSSMWLFQFYRGFWACSITGYDESWEAE